MGLFCSFNYFLNTGTGDNCTFCLLPQFSSQSREDILQNVYLLQRALKILGYRYIDTGIPMKAFTQRIQICFNTTGEISPRKKFARGTMKTRGNWPAYTGIHSQQGTFEHYGTSQAPQPLYIFFLKLRGPWSLAGTVFGGVWRCPLCRRVLSTAIFFFCKMGILWCSWVSIQIYPWVPKRLRSPTWIKKQILSI